MTGTMLRGDWKNIKRDPAYFFIFIAPLLIAGFLKFGVPVLFAFLQEQLGWDMWAYLPLIYGFFLQLPAYLAGMMMGMMLLEERDEGVLMMWSVTPLGRTGYLLYRIGGSFFLALVSQLLLIQLLMLEIGNALEMVVYSLPVSIAYSGGAPIMLILLTLFAADKVTGLALSKLAGIILAFPALLLLPQNHPGRIFMYLLYPVWNVKGFLFMAEGEGGTALLFSAVGFLLQAALVLAGYRLLNRATELPLRPGRRFQPGG
jgi:fluoroquinolone transport system permease protein